MEQFLLGVNIKASVLFIATMKMDKALGGLGGLVQYSV